MALAGVMQLLFPLGQCSNLPFFFVAFMAGRAILALCLFTLSNSQLLKLFDCSSGSAQYLNQQISKASFGQVPSAEH